MAGFDYDSGARASAREQETARCAAPSPDPITVTIDDAVCIADLARALASAGLALCVKDGKRSFVIAPVTRNSPERPR